MLLHSRHGFRKNKSDLSQLLPATNLCFFHLWFFMTLCRKPIRKIKNCFSRIQHYPNWMNLLDVENKNG